MELPLLLFLVDQTNAFWLYAEAIEMEIMATYMYERSKNEQSCKDPFQKLLPNNNIENGSFAAPYHILFLSQWTFTTSFRIKETFIWHSTTFGRYP